MSVTPGPPPTMAQRFDALAADYDQSGVDFFQPVARRLVELLAPRPGQRALDIGCGRGAAALPLAAAVGPSGAVTATDVSPAMVAATRAALDEAGAHHARTLVADAAQADLGAAYDVVAASLVLFFLPDPLDALTRWTALVAPDGGRIGLSTFGALDEPSRAIDALFDPWLPPGLLDARTTGAQGPFASDEGMLALMEASGARSVDNVTEGVVISFPDAAAWKRFSMSTGQRAMWQHVPDEEKPRLLDRAAQILDATREGGDARLVWQMRYTIGRR